MSSKPPLSSPTFLTRGGQAARVRERRCDRGSEGRRREGRMPALTMEAGDALRAWVAFGGWRRQGDGFLPGAPKGTPPCRSPGWSPPPRVGPWAVGTDGDEPVGRATVSVVVCYGSHRMEQPSLVPSGAAVGCCAWSPVRWAWGQVRLHRRAGTSEGLLGQRKESAVVRKQPSRATQGRVTFRRTLL